MMLHTSEVASWIADHHIERRVSRQDDGGRTQAAESEHRRIGRILG
jgi:hypothetical protein